MKAIGLSVILAQMGSYVPNSEMIFYPYKSVFSRIPSGDNLHQGQSSFIVELSELRNILKKADENSLIIGDEIMSSTEAVSAISIVSSSIIELSNKKSSFVFAITDNCRLYSGVQIPTTQGSPFALSLGISYKLN